MSITNARKFIEKSGCGWVTGGALIVVMLASIFSFNSCGGESGKEDQIRPVAPLASIGDQVVDANVLRDIADRNVQQAAGSEEGLDPAFEGRMYADIAQTLVSQALIRHVAAERGLSVTNEELKKDFTDSVEMQILQTRMQMVQQNLLKADATEAQFAEVFKNSTGRELADAKSESLAAFEKNLQDPVKRGDLSFDLLAKKVSESYKAKLTLSDADLKKGFDTYTTRRIIGYSANGKAAEARAKIEKALAEIEAGANFEATLNKYSDDPAQGPGKLKSESTVDLQYSILTYDASLKPILSLKVGGVTQILPTAQGPAIYKLYKIQNKLPPNFEAQKATLKDERLKNLATRAASDDLRKRVADVKFESSATKTLVDWRIAMSDPELNTDRTKLKSKLKEIFESLRGSNDAKLDARMLTLGSYGAFMDYWDTLSPAEREPLQTDRLELMKSALETSPHIGSFHELAKLAMAAKDGDTAFEALKSAMDTNSGGSESAISRHKSQALLRTQFANSGLAKGTQLKDLDTALARWRSDLFEDAKLAAESNADYTELGEQEYKTVKSNVDRYAKAGYVTTAQAAELNKALNKWKEGVYNDLKLQIEGNTDYSDIGQATFSDLNARLDQFSKQGYITLSQLNTLQALQSKWKVEKLKFDAEEAKKNPPKKDSAGTTGPTSPTPKQGGASSSDLLKGSTTGN